MRARTGTWVALLLASCALLAGCFGADPDRDDAAADAFDSGVQVDAGTEPEVWLAWSLVDRVADRRTGSANRATERTNAESSIKAWIALDFLRAADEAGRTLAAADLALIDRAIRASDDDAAEAMYRRLGRDRILADLDRSCGVHVATSQRGYWSYTQITAEDATRVLGCVLDQAPRYPSGERLLDDLHRVDPDGAFGIPEALGPDVPVAVKNGWTAHSGTGQWNVNCVAAWDRYTLSVLTRYPIDRGRDYGAAQCRRVTEAVVRALG